MSLLISPTVPSAARLSGLATLTFLMCIPIYFLVLKGTITQSSVGRTSLLSILPPLLGVSVPSFLTQETSEGASPLDD